MKAYKFTFKDKSYELTEENLDYFANDEENPVEGIDGEVILSLLNEAEEVQFDIEYYDNPCDKCRAGKAEKSKVFRFLEYHFFIFSKNGSYVLSNISKEFKSTSATQLFNSGKIENSYIVSIAVCENCGTYFIEIDQCEV